MKDIGNNFLASCVFADLARRTKINFAWIASREACRLIKFSSTVTCESSKLTQATIIY